MLDRKEMTRFRDYADSPYHNKHRDVRALVQHLSDIYPAFGQDTCDRKVLFRQLYPGEPHDQPRLAVLFTYTYRLLKRFLQQEAFERKEIDRSLLLLEEFRKRGQTDLYRQELQRVAEALENSPHRDTGYYFDRFRVAAEADRLFAEVGTHVQDEHLQDKQNQLDRYFIAEKLKDACEMIVRGKILKVSYQVQLLNPVLQEVRQQEEAYASFPSVIVYFKLYRLLSGHASVPWDEMVRTVQDRESFFHLEELQLLYNYLQNHCIEQINKGEGIFLRKAFSLYQYQLDKELLLVNRELPEWHYKNIVTIGLRLRENDWVRRFLEEYKGQLPPSARENAYSFNLASYYYQTGQLDRVLELLSQVEYKDVRYSLGAKALLLRTYYDLEAYEALLSLADAFRQFLKRNRFMTDQRLQAFSNLLKFTRKAARLKMNQDYLPPGKWKQACLQLSREVRRTEQIINRDWLEKKIDALV